jgi:hypothetical protein
MTNAEYYLVTRIRKACAKEFRRHVSDDFFSANARDGEDADDRLLRLFREEQAASSGTDEDVINALVHG